MEDKQAICDLLLLTLQSTRGASDLTALTYDQDTEVVTAVFEGRYIKRINVALDSGTAMIRDIINHLVV